MSASIIYPKALVEYFCLVALVWLILMALGFSRGSYLWAEQPSESLQFRIKGFALQGNTLFSKEDLSMVLKPFVGEQKTAEDVEKARDALERFYHERGYPTVLVNIPEQSVEDGVVWLQVVESEIRRVRVTGNRYFTMEKILDALPSLSPGEILHLPEVQRDLVRLNRNRDLKVAPVLIPGKAIGTVDVELKVEDKLPLHGSLELNNRSTHDTTHMRLNAMLSYDNLWQKDHSVSVQYQTSPKDTDEVKALAFSYVLPAPWNKDHVVAVYSINSDSETAFGEGFNTVGEGFIVGCRYVMPLPPKDTYAHNLTVGVDYKDFDEELGFGGEQAQFTPITYLPLSISYSSTLPDSSGVTQFSAGLNMAFRGLVTDQREFEIKRFQAKGNYLFATLGIERTQTLPGGFGVFLKVDGQLSNQPLISNEQYVAGGMKSVRGYKENEAVGDDALHGTVEFSTPDLVQLLGREGYPSCGAYAFYDVAGLRIQDPLPGQDEHATLQGAGAGVRGLLFEGFEYELAWAIVLESTDRTDSGDMTFHYIVRYKF